MGSVWLELALCELIWKKGEKENKTNVQGDFVSFIHRNKLFNIDTYYDYR